MNRVEKLLEFLKDSPDDSFLQHALALEYVKLGEEEKARELFEAILKREPGYLGSYYHLGKLLERTGNQEAAIQTYRDGMAACKQAGDQHAYNELQGALEELEDW